MKIGIVTIYDALNCGSFLQAYAMQTVLEDMGHEVVILKCKPTDLKRYIRRWVSKSAPVFTFRRAYTYRKDFSELHIQNNVLQKFDAVIIGSDEVWNLQGYFDHVKEFFGENLNTEKIIAYAKSLVSVVCGYP